MGKGERPVSYTHLDVYKRQKQEGVDISNPLIVCGSGNNGGDGFAIARLLSEEGIFADVVLVGRMESRSEETRTQMEILRNLGVSVGNCLPDREYSVIIDAVFGIGLSREIKGRYAAVSYTHLNRIGRDSFSHPANERQDCFIVRERG